MNCPRNRLGTRSCLHVHRKFADHIAGMDRDDRGTQDLVRSPFEYGPWQILLLLRQEWLDLPHPARGNTNGAGSTRADPIDKP